VTARDRCGDCSYRVHATIGQSRDGSLAICLRGHRGTNGHEDLMRTNGHGLMLVMSVGHACNPVPCPAPAHQWSTKTPRRQARDRGQALPGVAHELMCKSTWRVSAAWLVSRYAVSRRIRQRLPSARRAIVRFVALPRNSQVFPSARVAVDRDALGDPRSAIAGCVLARLNKLPYEYRGAVRLRCRCPTAPSGVGSL
jgi:hypothetical protein